MSDDFQRDALAPLMCPRHDCESTRHALNQLRVENKHLRAEIERLQRERDIASARLIAAAPDLLALAKRMLAAWEGSGPGIVLDDIRALIAKAEGRSDE